MGLWLKCPKCQACNSLAAQACAFCGESLEDLPREKRVYVLTPPGTKPAPAKAAAPAAKAARTKKAEAKPPAEKPARGWEVEGPPPKRPKGPKAVVARKAK